MRSLKMVRMKFFCVSPTPQLLEGRFTWRVPSIRTNVPAIHPHAFTPRNYSPCQPQDLVNDSHIKSTYRVNPKDSRNPNVCVGCFWN